MSTKRRVNKRLAALCECAIMLALAYALSLAKLFRMPLGGSVTFASMLPIMLIGIKYGPAIGLGTGLLYSVTQIMQDIPGGSIFPYCETSETLIICVVFDYIFPFTVLGLAGLFIKLRVFKSADASIYMGMASVVGIRFISHFITGVAIWGQWAPDGMNKLLYSFLYNGLYLSVDFIICIAVAFFMLKNSEIRRILDIPKINK